jgi:hypothetical protein
MSAILKVRIPFYRRKTQLGGNDGSANLYLKTVPTYLPAINATVLITHTDVSSDMGLKTKINSTSTNVFSATFTKLETNSSQESITDNDEYQYFFLIRYNDTTMSTSASGGDCRGYIEYDINPGTYSVLKPIESKVVVNESVPFDLNDGINNLTNRVTGTTYPTNFIKGMFVKRTDTNTIFANLLKSLNLPVADEEMKKYTRTELGTLTTATGTTYDTVIESIKKKWTAWTTTGTTTTPLVVHPVTGYTGEYYDTALQTIGSYEYTKTNKAVLPIPNELFLIFEVPNGSYGELIDGKSIKFSLPYYTGTTSNVVDAKLGYYTYSASPLLLEMYGTYNKKNLTTYNLDKVTSERDLSVKDIGIRPDLTSLSTYESNVVLLFGDLIKKPQPATSSSWSDGYVDLLDGTRVFNSVSQEKSLFNYNLDECIGFAVLDKGFVVITHPKVVDSYFRNVFNGSITKSLTTSLPNSNKNYDVNGVLATGTTRGYVATDPTVMLTTKDENDKIIWDSSQFVIKYNSSGTSGLYSAITGQANITTNMGFISYNSEKSLNIVCLASSDEFFKSTNDTAKELTTTAVGADFSNFYSVDQNLYPIIITQLGIHDSAGNLLAVCKPTQPVKKYWYDVVSFNVKIRL